MIGYLKYQITIMSLNHRLIVLLTDLLASDCRSSAKMADVGAGLFFPSTVAWYYSANDKGEKR